jgi:hypothetical protein
MMRVTYACPVLTLAGGCSLSAAVGITQETAGTRLVRAALTSSLVGLTLPSWLSSTGSNMWSSSTKLRAYAQ